MASIFSHGFIAFCLSKAGYKTKFNARIIFAGILLSILPDLDVISFALGELKCPSLSFVYDMTWAEFCIRQYAYRRMDKHSWYKVREIAYSAMIGSHIDPKKLPKTKEKFIPFNLIIQDCSFFNILFLHIFNLNK